jgi:hypothetical protein
MMTLGNMNKEKKKMLMRKNKQKNEKRTLIQLENQNTISSATPNIMQNNNGPAKSTSSAACFVICLLGIKTNKVFAQMS